MTPYVWIKRDLFECPKHQGYTGIRDCAGTWALEDAQRFGLPIKEAYDRSHEHYALPLEAAPEFTNACFDDLARDHLQAKCAAKDAEIARLREENEKLASFAKSFNFTCAASFYNDCYLNINEPNSAGFRLGNGSQFSKFIAALEERRRAALAGGSDAS